MPNRTTLLLAALAVGMLGCQAKLMPLTNESTSVPLPALVHAAAFPEIHAVNLRAIGRAPFEVAYKSDTLEMKLVGYSVTRETGRNTIRFAAYADRMVLALDSHRRVEFKLGSMKWTDYERDARGLLRAIHLPTRQDFPAASPDPLLDQMTWDKVVNSAIEGERNSAAALQHYLPVFKGPVAVGSTLYADSVVEFLKRAAIGGLAMEGFVDDAKLRKFYDESDEEVRRYADRNREHVAFSGSVPVVGTAYHDGSEFIHSAGSMQFRVKQESKTVEMSTLIDPYSGQLYVWELKETLTGPAGARTSSARFIYDLPKRYAEVSRFRAAPAPAAVRAGAPGSIAAVYDRAKGGVFTVVAGGKSQGSGFAIAPSLGVTSRHVINGETSVRIILSDGRQRDASVMPVSDAGLDLAFLQLDPRDGLVPLPLQADVSPTGEQIIVIGSPRGLASTLTTGIVSANRSAGEVSFVQIDAAMNFGNSGGPILNLRGEVIGVATFVVRESEGLNFGITARHVLDQAQRLPAPLQVRF